MKNIHIAATRRTMSKGPSLLARLQDRSTKLLFGEDGGTGESFEIDSHIAVSVRRRTPRESFIVLQFRSHNFIVFNDTDTNSFYDIVDRDIDGNDVKMDKFRGNVLCVVNVASKWGLTNVNYVQFSKLYDLYGSRGFKILAFPCNQFGAQEPVRFMLTNFACLTHLNMTWHRLTYSPPCTIFFGVGVGDTQGTKEQILEFVESKFGAKDKFTWFEKGHVNGTKTRELYSFLKGKLPSDDGTADIRWNFAKFLIDHEGTPIKRYGPKTNPEDLGSDIEQLLKKMEDAVKG